MSIVYCDGKCISVPSFLAVHWLSPPGLTLPRTSLAGRGGGAVTARRYTGDSRGKLGKGRMMMREEGRVRPAPAAQLHKTAAQTEKEGVSPILVFSLETRGREGAGCRGPNLYY